MSKTVAVFEGEDASLNHNLWVTDGTAAGSSELSVAGVGSLGLFWNVASPDFTVLDGKVLFDGADSSNNDNLWVTDGTGAGTSELSVSGVSSSGLFPSGFRLVPGFTVLGGKALFEGVDSSGHFGLWVTDGTSAGTSEFSVAGAGPNGLGPVDLTVFGTKVVFNGNDASGQQLWITDGTAAGTSEISVSGAGTAVGLDPTGFTVLGGKVLFAGFDSRGNNEAWVTDGTSAGTSELTNVNDHGSAFSGEGASDITVFGSKALFDGTGGLWVTDGTGAGTSELSTTGFSGVNTPDFTVFGTKVLFAGIDSSGNTNLWTTDGTSAGTSELSVTGANASGLFSGALPPDFTILGTKVLFEGKDAAGNTNLWVTDGTSAGTSELSVTGANLGGGLFFDSFAGAPVPPDFTVLGSQVLFNGEDSRGNYGLWVTDGTSRGTSELSVVAESSSAFSPADFTLFAVPCFVAGTRIATLRGDVVVEDLRVGDRVLTARGEPKPIVWIGDRRVDCRRHPNPEAAWPARIKAGAFGGGLPKRDLCLSPDHAVFAERVLIPVKYLINGGTVVREHVDSVHYFHVELDRHDILLAEGLPTESYLDTGNRAQFADGAAHITLHPDFALLSWDDACAPLCTEGRALAAVRQGLRDRMLDASGLRVIAGGQSIRAAAIKGGLHRFLLPPGSREIAIVSSKARTVYLGRSRELGVCIDGIVADGKPVPLDSAALGAGFHPIEPRGAKQGRWTDGAAQVHLPCAGSRPIVLELLVRETVANRQLPGSATERAAAA